jgi:hypothetical protein
MNLHVRAHTRRSGYMKAAVAQNSVCYSARNMQEENVTASIDNAKEPSKTHEAWLLTTSHWMGDRVASGAFRQLTDLVALDTRFRLAGDGRLCFMASPQ